MWTYTYMDIQRSLAELYDTYSKRGINIALISGAIPEHRTDGTYSGTKEWVWQVWQPPDQYFMVLN